MLGCAAPDVATSKPVIGSTKQAENTTFYEIPFVTQGTKYDFMPDKTVALTFDDGPDWGCDSITDSKISDSYTYQVLDVLKEAKVPATFFINGNNYSDIDTEAEMQQIVQRIVTDGHDLGNHTWHHWSLGYQGQPNRQDPGTPDHDLSEAEIDDEISHVEKSVDKIFGGAGKVRLTMLRAPFGEPIQDLGAQEGGQAKVSTVEGVIAKHAVHVAWNMDDYDYALGCTGPAGGDPSTSCDDKTACGLMQIQSQLGGGNGVILMHSVQKQEVNSLPLTIKYLKDNGYKFWTVEQVICAKYGKYSAELIDGASDTKCNQSDPQPIERDLGTLPPIMTGDGDSGDGDAAGDGDKGSNGDGDKGSNGDGDKGSNGDGDKGSNGDGDGDGDSSNGDGDGSNSGTTKNSKGCSVDHRSSSDLGGVLALGLGLFFVTRRRREKR